MPKLKDIKFYHCDIEDFAYWMNERHKIYLKKSNNEPKPWTEDSILQQYKFTNVFRQLDKGTVALQEMLNKKSTIALLNLADQNEKNTLIFFNICWYRLFNWYEHAQKLGFVVSYEEVENYIEKRFRTYKKIFTGAYMTTGVAYEDKYVTYLRAVKDIWNCKESYTKYILNHNNIEKTVKQLQELYMVGKFVAYELACDLRFTILLKNATDKLTWTNMGPGAQRGLRRLGLYHKSQQQGLESMLWLYKELIEKNLLGSHILNAKVPFELREVEHSLCEFDKYQRVKMGEGRPRSKYNGV